MLNLRSPEELHLRTGRLYPLTNMSLCLLHSLVGNRLSCESQPIGCDAISYKCLRGSSGPIFLVESPTDIFPTGANAVADEPLWLLLKESSQKQPSGNFSEQEKELGHRKGKVGYSGSQLPITKGFLKVELHGWGKPASSKWLSP